MSKYLLSGLLFLTILYSCASSSSNSSTIQSTRKKISSNAKPVTSSFKDVDTSFIMFQEFPTGKTAASLMELPRTEDGAFVLNPGYYEADFKTYCLQPGTPAPSNHDAYFQAPLTGSRKDIIATILRNSQKETHLDQKNIQLLLWSVVSRSDFNKLSSPVQATAYQLLSQKQVFELKGGVLGVAKTVANVLPSFPGQSTIENLFDLGVNSYETYERLAVLNTPSTITRPDFKRDQWYKHQDGYYVRYFPNSYQQTKIQVYVPETSIDSTTEAEVHYMLFDPTSFVVVPANSNAQQLGIGAPVVNIVKSVIKIIGSSKGSPRPVPAPTPTPRQQTPPAGHPGSDRQ